MGSKSIEFNYYAVTKIGRDMLKSRTVEEAVAEVQADSYLSKAAREIVKISKEVVWSRG